MITDVLNRHRYRPYGTGLSLEHATNRACGKESHKEDQQGTIRVLMYIFPRQFGLHNVFTSTVDSQETAQSLKDYTLREDEIHSKFGGGRHHPPKVPKRLRREVVSLVKNMQLMHNRCAYKELLIYYCPATVSEKVL